MLVMRQAHRIGAEFLKQVEILALIGSRDCPAFHGPILVHGSASQKHVLAVEEEAVLGIELHAA